MIIVEGPDGAGKTTLIEKLERKMNLQREPRAVSHGAEKLKPIGQYIMDELDRGFGLRLYDRFALISSPMYLSLPNPTFSEEMLDVLWLQEQWIRFNAMDPVIIVCLPPFEVVKANVHKDETSQVVWGHPEIYWHYHNWMAQNFRNTSLLWYDYTRKGTEAIYQDQRLRGLLQWAQARVEKGRI